MVYTSVMQYVESKSRIEDQIVTLAKLIKEHEIALSENVSNSVIERNAWDDGQIRIDTVYRSPSAIMNAIETMDLMLRRKEAEYNRLTQGSVYELRDQSSFYR